MKITDIKQFKKILFYLFSYNFDHLKESEKDSIKKEIALSINKIEGARTEAIKQVRYDLEKVRKFYTGSSSTLENRKRIIYIFTIISEEDRINILSEYVLNENNIRGYEIDKEIFIPMINFISDELKVKILSKSDPVVLFKFMSEVNRIAENKKRYKKKERKEYEKYYEICQKALEKQNSIKGDVI